MQPRRNSSLIYGLLLGVWVLVVAWQVEEHVRVREAAKADLRNRSQEIASTVSAVIRASRFRGAVVPGGKWVACHLLAPEIRDKLQQVASHRSPPGISPFKVCSVASTCYPNGPAPYNMLAMAEKPITSKSSATINVNDGGKQLSACTSPSALS